MMWTKKFMIAAIALAGAQLVAAQGKYFTRTAHISFISNAPLEDIEAKNKTAVAVIDSKTGAVQFSVLMRGFEFEKSTMQEHFNENYVESGKYPRAEFRGTIVNNSAINYTKPGSYNAQVKGKLTIHGVTKEITTNGTVKVEATGISANASFNIAVKDYKISIPALVKDKVAKNVKINVSADLVPAKD